MYTEFKCRQDKLIIKIILLTNMQSNAFLTRKMKQLAVGVPCRIQAADINIGG